MNIFWTIALVLAGTFLIYALGFIGYRELIIEKPAYTVVEKNSGYEVRRYDSYIIASYTREAGDLNRGFIKVAGYILGRNETSQKIAMTSPVIDEPISKTNEGEKIAMTSPVIDNSRSTAFVLPSEYSIGDLPMPTDPDVVIKEIPEITWAVKRFVIKDFRDKNLLEKEVATLYEDLERDRREYIPQYQFAFYDPPGLWWPLRRNEVWVRLK